MDQYAVSLNRFSKGQIVIETLFALALLLAFLIFLQNFHLTARQEIQQERLSKKQVYKKQTWIKSIGKEVKNEGYF